MTIAAFALALQVLSANQPPSATPQSAPTAPRAVVERFVTSPAQFTRLSLFDNRIAVVSRRHGDQVVVRRRLLSAEEYAVYLAEIIRDADTFADGTDTRPLGESDPTRVELLVELDSQAPMRRLVYSPLRLQSLPLERLQHMLDDLEALVLATPPAQVELATWRPHIGDRVELVIGRRATVIRIEDDGLVVLEHDGTHVRELVPVAGRTAAIRALLGRDP